MNASEDEFNLSNVEQVVRKHYGETIWDGIKVGIGLVASMSLKERDKCLVLMYVGTSGYGKTTAVSVFEPDRPSTLPYFYRLDNFTHAAFVSQFMGAPESKLQKQDLLPKIKDKVMLMKECATLFRGDERQLTSTFKVLTSVLDGTGYITASGVHGTRGYEGRYLFNWIGATTPISERTHKTMAQVGNRMLFYQFRTEEPSNEELIDFAKFNEGIDALKESRAAVNEFLDKYFKRHPLESVERHSVTVSDELIKDIVLLAKLVAHGRVEVELKRYETEEGVRGVELNVGAPEGARRIIVLFQMLAKGLALASGRSAVAVEDLRPLRHIAISCLPQKRRECLEALLANGGQLTATYIEKILRVSRPTVHSRMKELAATRIVKYCDGDPRTSSPSTISLSEEWKWLIESPP